MLEYELVMNWLILHKEQQEYKDRYYEIQDVMAKSHKK